MTKNNIESHMCELYGIEIFDSTINRITYKILSLWGNGRNNHWKICVAVFMDALITMYTAKVGS